MNTHYYFDTIDGNYHFVDDAGLALGTDREARVEAVKAITDMASEMSPDGRLGDLTVQVRDRHGLLFEYHLSLTVKNHR